MHYLRLFISCWSQNIPGKQWYAVTAWFSVCACFFVEATLLFVLKKGKNRQCSKKVGQMYLFMLEVPYRKYTAEQQGQSKNA